MANYYVDPSGGSDTTGTGAETSPWQTIGHALASAAAGDTIYCFPGQFNEGSLDISPIAGGVIEALGDCTIYAGGHNYAINGNSIGAAGAAVTMRGFKITGWEADLYYHASQHDKLNLVGCTVYQYGGKYQDANNGLFYYGVATMEFCVVFGIGRMKRPSGYGHAWRLRNCSVTNCGTDLGTFPDFGGVAYTASDIASLQGTGGLDASATPPPFTDAGSPTVSLDLRWDVSHANYATYRFGAENGKMYGNPSRRVIFFTEEYWGPDDMTSNPQFGALENDENYYDTTGGGPQPGADPNAAPTVVNAGTCEIDTATVPAGTNSRFVTPVLVAPGSSKYKLQLLHVGKILDGLGAMEAWYRGSDTPFAAQDASPAWVSMAIDGTTDLEVEYKYLQVRIKLDADG